MNEQTAFTHQRTSDELKERYYLVNFHTLAGFVMSTYADLMHEDETAWYRTVRSLSSPAQCLYIRLLSRRGSSFRIGRLNYPEIDSVGAGIGAYAEELADHGLATLAAPEPFSALLASFTKPELIEKLGLSTQRNMSRPALVAHIESRDSESVQQYKQHLQQSEQWVSIKGHAHWTLMQLCFFGNLYQDSSEFVLSQMGTLRYEDYPMDRTARVFTSREQIEAHWRYFECEVLYESANKRCADDLLRLSAALPVIPETSESAASDLTLLRRVDRIRNRIARQLERLSQPDEAMGLYRASIHPPARERQVRIMMSREQWRNAAVLSEHMLREPHNDAEYMIAQRLHAQCRKAMGLSYDKRKAYKPESSKLVLHDSGSGVEEQARIFFSCKGECYRTENVLVNGVLGLFIWDIIFHPVPGVFHNPFQAGPSDFTHPQFVTRRQVLLDERFLELNDPVAFKNRVLEAYRCHFGKVNPLVRWHLLSIRLLNVATERIPPNHWHVLFVRILKDLRDNTSGFPDLVLFPDNGGYEFLEIKGPGDTLQSNQRRWMQYFDEHGIACRLVHIRYRLTEPSCNNIDVASR